METQSAKVENREAFKLSRKVDRDVEDRDFERGGTDGRRRGLRSDFSKDLLLRQRDMSSDADDDERVRTMKKRGPPGHPALRDTQAALALNDERVTPTTLLQSESPARHAAAPRLH